MRKKEALRRIEVSVEELRNAPNITAILKETPGGIGLAIKAMRFSGQGLIAEFLAKYDSISERDRKSLSIEAIALSLKMDIRHLWGEIMLAIREHSVSQVKIIAVAAHPAVIKKRVQFAQRRDGYRDRDALDTMLGALPSSQGATFINKFFAAGKEEVEDGDEPKEELVSDINYVFPDSEVMQERVQPMRQRLLEK